MAASKFMLLLNTAPAFKGPPLIKALKERFGEEPVAAWASATTFGMFLSAEATPADIYRAITESKVLVTSILVIELGKQWISSDAHSRAAGWLQGNIGPPKVF